MTADDWPYSPADRAVLRHLASLKADLMTESSLPPAFGAARETLRAAQAAGVNSRRLWDAAMRAFEERQRLLASLGATTWPTPEWAEVSPIIPPPS